MRAAAHSVGVSPAAQRGGIRQHEQVQTGEQEQGEREQRQEAHPDGLFLPYQGDDVDYDGAVKAMDSQRWICRTHLFQFNGDLL